MLFIKKTNTPKKTIMDAFQLGLKHTTGHLDRCPEREVLFEDFEASETVSFPAKGSVLTPTHDHGDFKFTMYAPVTFGLFRDNLGIRSGDFQRSLCSQPLTERSDGQRDGGSLTYLSGDDKFMVSTLQPKEAEVLQQMLPHLNQDRQSLLPRFLGLYCVQMGANKVQLAVMSNPIPSSVRMHLKYALKGSSNRTASAKERTKENPTYKDLDFTKDLPGGLLLSTDKYKTLCRSIQSDCLLLQSFGMMNYRLLVGILNLDLTSQGQGETEFEAKLPAQMARQDVMGAMAATNSKGERLLLFVGINDIFRPYTFAKKLEHYCKAAIYDANTVSVSKPSFYSKRFQRFMFKSVFKPVVDTSPGDGVEPSSLEAKLEMAMAPEVEVKAHFPPHVAPKCPSPAPEHVEDDQEEEDEEGTTHQSAKDEDLQSVAVPIQGMPISATSGHDAVLEVKDQEGENNEVSVRHQPSAKVKDFQSSGCGEHQKDGVRQEDGVEEGVHQEDGVEEGVHQEFKPMTLRVKAGEKVQSFAMKIEPALPITTEEGGVHQEHAVEEDVQNDQEEEDEEGTTHQSAKDEHKNKMALRSKRNFSLCVLLMYFKLSKLDVIDVIQKVKLGIFDAGELKQLVKLLPEEYNVKDLESFRGVDHVDDFYYSLIWIPGYKLRVECLILCSEAKELREMILTQAKLVEKACRSLRESVYLPFFRSLVGNLLINGSLMGNAAGFRISSLVKLADTKVYRSETTLHYILQVLEKNHYSGLFSVLNADLEVCDKAADFDLKHSQAELGILVKRLEDTGKAIASSADRLEPCQDVIKDSLQACRGLEQMLSEIDRTRRELASHLCEDADELFGTMKTFRRLFNKSLRDIGIWGENCNVTAYPSGRCLPVQRFKA